jgi:hypothetical protein
MGYRKVDHTGNQTTRINETLTLEVKLLNHQLKEMEEGLLVARFYHYTQQGKKRRLLNI